jgi:enoyl-CoA hydratase/carnithine racemase
LRALNCKRVTLDTTEPLTRAIRFYERNGFRQSGRVSDFFGMKLIEYVKEIAATLKVERKDRILLLTFDRAEKRNALHPQLIAELSHAFFDADRDDSIHAIVLTGAGTSFCAGLDLAHLVMLDSDGKTAYVSAFFELFQRISAVRQPVLAAVNGPAWAGGFDLAAACDLRLCSPQATFAQPEVLLGLTQMMYPVYKVIGLGRATELALTGEPINADEAYRIGLVSRVCRTEHVVEVALHLARQLAFRPKEALFATKRLSHELIELDTKSAFTRMLDSIRERLKSDEHRAAVEKYVGRVTSARSTS